MPVTRNHRRSRGVALLVLGVVLCALTVAPLEATPRDPQNSDPLRLTRLVHRLHLQRTGAHVRSASLDALQRAHNDCAITIVERLYDDAGRPRPDRETLARELALGARGVALPVLAATLTRLGWPAVLSRPVGDSVPAAPRPPAIALVRPGHYVLVTRVTATHAEYFDPLIGQVTEPLPPFAARWTGKSVQLSIRDR